MQIIRMMQVMDRLLLILTIQSILTMNDKDLFTIPCLWNQKMLIILALVKEVVFFTILTRKPKHTGHYATSRSAGMIPRNVMLLQKNGLQSIGEGLLGMQKTNGKLVMIDKAMNEIGSSYDGSHGVFSCGLIGVYKSEKGYGFINKKGDEIVPCKYANVWDYTDNATWVKKESDSNWEALDTKGESLFKLKEDEMPESGFHNGLALVYRSEWDKENYKYIYTYRYVDKTGETVYKWTPGEDDEDEAPKSWEELNRENIMRTEEGAIVREIEEMNALMAR